MNRKLTAALLIAAAVLTNVAFTALGTVFNNPDVLKEPAGEVLAAFRASQATVSTWFAVLALSAALFAPITIGVGRLSARPAMRWAVPVGIAAAAVQVIGLLRWPLLVPGYAAAASSADPAVAAAGRDSFVLAHRILGTIVGETLGYLLTAAWTLLVLAALGAGDRRPLVYRSGRGIRGPDPRRRVVAAGSSPDRPGQLRRLHPVERLAGGVRRPTPAPALSGTSATIGPALSGTRS